MFTKILIANRGEIACRVMETAREMGVSTVAVYSDADRDAKHMAMADEAVHIGGAAPAESYLRGDRIIQAALAMGAQAIHPGYGFLSENPDFVEEVEQAGLVFIGPSADAIRKMGLKDAAKALMQKSGVPVVPGYHGDTQDPAFLAQQADEIGYPMLIKAVAGGGGKGMRLVESPEDFAAALESAQGEAVTAFGNGDVLIERYIQQPRHIEVQVFGDGERAVHLFERDCSLQRRHQKVIEEAPAPGMTHEMRAAMGQAAVRAAEAIGYKGAGTVEFIVDGRDGLRPEGFWFMEMNTRLQVEHPVTEAITGVDLVEWQLRAAAGEALPVTQEQLTITGHSFEVRLYAEDVAKGFLPATGTLEHLVYPSFTRVDSGVRSGDVISPFYDPMIAKIVTHGATREFALGKMRQAIEACQIAGLQTNLAFLGALCWHEEFARGEVDTGLIARDLKALVQEPDVTPQHWAQAAMAGLGLLGEVVPETGFTLWQPLTWSISLQQEQELREIAVTVWSADQYEIVVGEVRVRAQKSAAGWRFDDVHAPTHVITGDEITLFWPRAVTFTRHDPLARGSEEASSGNVVEAPMPGVVKSIFAISGQVVTKGDRLAILEAMKMEHTLLAMRDGVVADIVVEEGAQVEAGAVLITLVAEEESQ
ncbi:Acetyl-/propionyl-coenzyme A carboxylase alpha chain [Roseovarius albus]|uniref:Acetyl-/propionyl-coenzyme A carboxylase alpha chain n=1 Tax=Roseovarius albus TaxID=1247867 RepID=A0A1X6ZF03_9RHOB|nr:acetyl/propionyl/methylcrotonyl-CoA carboxylase subunit alpha [Roseovarius albus]SLN49416.1 Acetyl-/propionyl-coenzyme A carboxylase alpha chain [Roseovarius albus]